MLNPLVAATATELAERLRRREVSSVEVVEAHLDRIDEVDAKVNAIPVRRERDAILADAAQLDALGEPAGPLHGLPIAVKELEAVAGLPTTSGATFTSREPVAADGLVAARLRAAGAVIIGKTNVPEFGLLPVSESNLYGPARNPWNPDHTPGGSSGGSAAAVAAGIVPLAHANDGGGSIRIPASSSGLVGLKPSRARIPQGPVIGDAMSGLTADLVVSRTVRDTAVALDIAAGPEPGDPYFAPHHEGIWSDDVGVAPGSLRIGFTTRTIGGERRAAADPVGQVSDGDHIGIGCVVAFDHVEVFEDHEGRAFGAGGDQD